MTGLEITRHIAAIVRDVMISVFLMLVMYASLSMVSSLNDYFGHRAASSPAWPSGNDDCSAGHTAGGYVC